MKGTFANSKIKSITVKVSNQVTPLDTSTIPTTLYYNIVEDMKKIHTNISLFELTRITSLGELLFRTLKQPSSSKNVGNNTERGGESLLSSQLFFIS